MAWTLARSPAPRPVHQVVQNPLRSRTDSVLEGTGERKAMNGKLVIAIVLNQSDSNHDLQVVTR